MKYAEKERRSLYIIGWLLPGIAAVCLLLSKVLGVDLGRLVLPCIFHSVTGLYCPGCGGTRALRLLLHGDILQSLYYHPLVLYGAVLYGWFMVSNSVEYLSRGKYKIGMRYRKWYVTTGLILLILNFLIKNGAMLIWHYPMIE